MPSKSKAQRNLMAAAAHNPAFAKKVGVPVSVAQEFNKADKGKKFGSGGMAKTCATKSDAKMIAKKEVKGHEKSMHGMKKGGITEKGTGEKYASKAAMMKHEKTESKAEEMKEHGMKKGGRIASKGEHAVQKQSKRGAEIVKMCGGGMKKYARGGGVEVRGKTKGKIC